MSATKTKTNPGEAQAPGNTSPEQPAATSFDPSKLAKAADVEAFMSSYKAPDTDVFEHGLKWKSPEIQAAFRTRYFRHDEIDQNLRQIHAENFVQVRKGDAILDIPFTDIFEADQFDKDDGTISKGQVLDKQNNRRLKEVYLFLQPIGAQKALSQLRAESSKRYVNPKRLSDEMQSRVGKSVGASGKSSDSVRISEAEMGSQDDASDWEGLGR